MSLYLSQYDKRWANQRIGNSWLTVGRWGCALTSLCMSLNDFGIPMLPDVMAAKGHWFTNRGLVIWKNIEEGLQQMYPNKSISITRYSGRNDRVIKAALKPGTGVLLQVAYGSHWIKADRPVWWRWWDYQCRDPLGGVKINALGRYRNISGYTIIKISDKQ